MEVVHYSDLPENVNYPAKSKYIQFLKESGAKRLKIKEAL